MKVQRIRYIAVGVTTLTVCVITCFGEPAVQKEASKAAPAEERPTIWAHPIEMEGVPNLYKVSDTLYRSAQPTAGGMRNLKEHGIQTIINVRSFHSDRDEIGETGLRYEHIYMKPWHPEKKEIVRFLHIVADPDRTPALVHCQHGADRTGFMSATYRMAIQGWTKEEALKELTEGGFGFHKVWKNMLEWFKKLDMDEMKRRAGLAKTNLSEQ
ncbi:MAG: dual specificity protein phosphatase family protein [Candidatus Hydrogenedentota bacterium]